ncbi:MAG: peroxiredoxin, partial [Bdellovibrionaceae bacterium]|nr:peroxiredoxin [Pseudobdellovibrionaceae bacterium]
MATTKAKTQAKTKAQAVSKGKISKPAAKTSAAQKAGAKLALVGKALPEFELPATGEKVISSKVLQGKKVVLFFYPKDSTPGCTIEGQDFTRLHDKFKAAGAEVFGVSRDSLKSHEKFKTNQKYSIDLLSDEDESVCNLFGVIKMKNMYGRQVRGIERSTFIIDAN